MNIDINLIPQAEAYITSYFKENMSEKYVYHDLRHTQEVVAAVEELAAGYSLTEEEVENLHLAAWFHDTGYTEGPEGHEDRSCTFAANWLENKGLAHDRIDKICALIMATKLPQNPKNISEQIIGDADLSHLGKTTYWERCDQVRQEMANLSGKNMTEKEWTDFEIHFMENHDFHSSAAQKLYEKRKQKYVRQLLKQKIRLHPTEGFPVDPEDVFDEKAKKFKKPTAAIAASIVANSSPADVGIKDMRLGRGVETMYRTTYRTHVNLSSIADNKANIMLSINAIIISIVFSNLVPRLTNEPNLLLPTAALILTCLIAIIFATLSTRPKITEGKFTRKDIEEKKSNLLFFGNFYNMELKDYEWGVEEMIKDENFLYSSMTRDIYWLGKVLAKKYRYLSICYGVFMYGLIVTVAIFLFTFIFNA